MRMAFTCSGRKRSWEGSSLRKGWGDSISQRESQGPERGTSVSVWGTARRPVGLEQCEGVGWGGRWLSWRPGGPWKSKQRHGFCSKENGYKEVMLPDTAYGLTTGGNFPFLCCSTQSTSKAAIFFTILGHWVSWSSDLWRAHRWITSSRQHLKTTKCLQC